jgi:hypothetical protein
MEPLPNKYKDGPLTLVNLRWVRYADVNNDEDIFVTDMLPESDV